MLKYIFVFILLISFVEYTYSQPKQLQMQNKKYSWQHRNITEGNKIKIVFDDNTSKKGILFVLNDSTIRVNSDTILLKDIACVKKDKIWKIVLESGVIATGSFFIGVGTIAIIADPNGWGLLIGIVMNMIGIPTATLGAVTTSIKNSYPNYKWNYKIGVKKNSNY